MSTEQKKFVLYQYLEFFWKRKLVLICLPIFVAILFAVVYHLFFYNEEYIGKSLIYSGSVLSDDVANPTNLQARYEKIVKNNNKLEIRSHSYGYIDVKIVGENKDSVYSDLNNISNKIEVDLIEESNQRLNATKESIKAYQIDSDKLQNLIENFSISEDNLSSLEQILVQQSRNAAEIRNMNNDVALHERPEILSVNQEESKSYIVETALSGFVIGAILIIFLLILLKYINDARNYFQSK